MGHLPFCPRQVLFSAAFVALATTTISAQDPDAKLGKLAVQGCDFALDPASGNLAAVDPRQDLVVLYKPEPAGPETPIEPIARTKLRGLPVAIVYKQLGGKGFFIVGCLKESALYVLGAADLKEEGRIPIGAASCVGLTTAASPRDPYVYYCAEEQNDAKTGVVDLNTRRDFGIIVEQSRDTAVSAEGSFLYTRRKQDDDVRALRRVLPPSPDGKPTYEPLVGVAESYATLVPDPFERALATATQVYTPQLDKELGRLALTVKAYFTSKPLVVGFNTEEFGRSAFSGPGNEKDGKLVVASLNSGAKLAKATIPPYFFDHPTSSTPRDEAERAYQVVGHYSRLFVDDARGRIVLAWRDRLATAALADLRIPDEPYLEVDIAGRSAAVVGRRNVVPLRPRDPRITIELAEPRDDMRITPAGLEWTPPEDAVGEQIVKLQLRHGATSKAQDLPVQVEHESIALPLEADGIAVSFDEKEAFVWTVPTPNQENPFAPGADPNKNRSRGAMVSLADGRIIASGLLPFTPRAVALNGRHVFASGTDRLVAFDRAAFRIEAETPVAGTIDVLRLVDERSLAGCIGRSRRLKFSAADLRPELDYGPHDTGGRTYEAYASQYQGNLKVGIWPAGEGWAAGDGDVFDRSFSRPVLLQQTPSFIPINRLQTAVSFESSPFQSSGQMIGTQRNRVLVGFDRLPARHAVAALIRSLSAPENVDGTGRVRKQTETYTLSIFDRRVSIENGVPDRSLVLARGTYESNRFGMREMDRVKGGLTARGEVIYCTVQGKLFRVAPAGGGPAAESPAAFEPKQSHLVLDRAGRTSLTHWVSGGIGPYTFSLIEPTSGLSIDAAGTVTADGPRLTALALDRLVGPLEPDGGHFVEPNLKSPEFAAGYVLRNSPLFEQIVGRPPAGFPVAVVIGVQATDRTPYTTKLTYQALLEIPPDQIAARVQAVAERANRVQAGGGMPREARFENLERRIGRLEEQIKSMTQLLQQAK